MYSQVLGVIKKECQFLIEVCDGIQDREGGGAQSGFDFLVNSVWPEIVSLFEAKASLVFAPGNPDNFHKVRFYDGEKDGGRGFYFLIFGCWQFLV